MNCAACLVARRLIGLLIVAVVFSLATHYAWMVLVAMLALGLVPAWRAWMWCQALRLGLAMDRVLAAQFGASGQLTVTQECANRRESIFFCKWVCFTAELFDPGHCSKAVKGA